MEEMELFDPISKPKIIGSSAKLSKLPEKGKIEIEATDNRKRKVLAKGTKEINE